MLKHIRVPIALLLLGAVPIAAGAFRLTKLTGPATEEGARFAAAPIPIVLHIVGATVFTVVGAFQFAPNLRRFAWHRIAGRLALPCGLIAALSGLYMTITYPHPASDAPLLTVFRLIFGTIMAVALVLGLLAIRRRDIAGHRAWVIRGYAVGIASGTQAVVTLPWFIAFGEPTPLPRALLLGAAWVLNLVVAEAAIRRRARCC
ncbi:putative membrane protein [Actinokineospora baliensis]|uniref:DUF2306 domain-containing protein n=1 Tax=Actinokineospora baliensis TaxID=547056 RepID=UPI00195658C2|nr:DUF2306 domain-containing protein [Actinokineospora baliensis]MBM7775546.1 putative membrane protein [Actinokineospora baliensis]